MHDRNARIAELYAASKERILLLDGAWGVMLQKMGLGEADYRNEHFNSDTYPGQMKGNPAQQSWVGHAVHSIKRRYRSSV